MDSSQDIENSPNDNLSKPVEEEVAKDEKEVVSMSADSTSAAPVDAKIENLPQNDQASVSQSIEVVKTKSKRKSNSRRSNRRRKRRRLDETVEPESTDQSQSQSQSQDLESNGSESMNLDLQVPLQPPAEDKQIVNVDVGSSETSVSESAAIPNKPQE